jgi:predicted DNA-binding transcriptional regulator AlpA
MASDLIGLGELGDVLGVSRSTAARYASDDERERLDFPEPEGTITGRRVWRRTDVERWGREHLPLRPGRPPSTEQ